MKIRPSDGTVAFSFGEISRSHDRAQFLESPIGVRSKEGLHNEPWRHYEISPEPGVAGSVLFRSDEIQKIFLMMLIPSDRTDQWTAELELERKSIHDRWLQQELGDPPWRYAWGKVVSEFDPKTVASEIIVVYDR
jgi:hypothetical protein